MGLMQLTKISRESIATKVYEHIKQHILDGTLPPGTHLVETTIAEQLGTSRGPVREALRQLEANGIVEVRANIGTFVRELSSEEVREIYTARSVLEGYLARLTATKATPAEIEQLYQAVEAASEAASRGSLEDTVNADFNLHRLIWQISGHKIIYDLLSHLEVRIRLFITLQAQLFETLSMSIQDHRFIVDAIASRDSEHAEAAIREHIMNAGLRIVDHIRHDNYKDGRQ